MNSKDTPDLGDKHTVGVVAKHHFKGIDMAYEYHTHQGCEFAATRKIAEGVEVYAANTLPPGPDGQISVELITTCPTVELAMIEISRLRRDYQQALDGA